MLSKVEQTRARIAKYSAASKAKAIEEAEVIIENRRLEKTRSYTVDSDGVITYEQIGWEPPKDIQGYQRDSENVWRFVPMWPECEKRTQEIQSRGCCGCIQIVMQCLNSTSSFYEEEVTFEQCLSCDKR